MSGIISYKVQKIRYQNTCKATFLFMHQFYRERQNWSSSAVEMMTLVIILPTQWRITNDPILHQLSPPTPQTENSSHPVFRSYLPLILVVRFSPLEIVLLSQMHILKLCRSLNEMNSDVCLWMPFTLFDTYVGDINTCYPIHFSFRFLQIHH